MSDLIDWLRAQLVPRHAEQEEGMAISDDELRRRFVYHAPNAETRGIHEAVREATLAYVYTMVKLVDNDTSDELDLWLRDFERSTFWMHAHIARNR